MNNIFSEIPKDDHWNFVEINSTNDLLAMANPHQKKYKTKQKTSKNESSKKKNNWNLFRHKFPVFLNKSSSEKVAKFNVNKSKKDKRHITKEVRRKEIPGKLGDPWASVSIREEDNKHLAFGLYDEFGRKKGAKIEDTHKRDSLKERVTVEEDRDTYVRPLNKDNNVLLNITIDLDGVKIKDEVEDFQAEPQGKNDKSNTELLDEVSKKFSEKLELLYEKLAALKSLETKVAPLPPVGQIGKLNKPIALTMRQDGPLYTRAVFQPIRGSYPGHLITPDQSEAYSKNSIPYAGAQSTPNSRQSRQKKGMLGILKRQLHHLVPPKLQHFLDRKSVTVSAPPLPTLPPVFIPHLGQPIRGQYPGQLINPDQSEAGQSRSQSLSSPPWPHHGLPTQIQQQLSQQHQHQEQTRNEKSIFGLLLPRLKF